MSRHEFVPLNPAHEIVVGWDRPMNTFFAQVLDTAADEESDSFTVLWVGNEFDQVPDPATAINAVRPFAILESDLLQQLRDDQMASD